MPLEQYTNYEVTDGPITPISRRGGQLHKRGYSVPPQHPLGCEDTVNIVSGCRHTDARSFCKTLCSRFFSPLLAEARALEICCCHFVKKGLKNVKIYSRNRVVSRRSKIMMTNPKKANFHLGYLLEIRRVEIQKFITKYEFLNFYLRNFEWMDFALSDFKRSNIECSEFDNVNFEGGEFEVVFSSFWYVIGTMM